MSIGPLSELTCVRGESFIISGPAGDVVPRGDQGFYVRDTRFLDRLELRVDGVAPLPLSGGSIDASRAIFHAHLPSGERPTADATVLVTRRRVVAGGLHEEVELLNAGAQPAEVNVELVTGTDFAYIFDVKHGRTLPAVLPEVLDGGLEFRRPGGPERVTVHSPMLRAVGDRLRAALTLQPGSSVRCCVDVTVQDGHGSTGPEARCAALREPPRRWFDDDATGVRPAVVASEPRFARLVRGSLADLRSLELRDTLAPDDRFLAAGTPWYLTLFGRDALWAALMALPFDPDLAGGTLRVLARRQGTHVNRATEEEPGKILHEVRRGALAEERGDLPAHYFGTVDATPLFVIVAHEAWCWGLPTDQVEALLPSIEAALAWMRDYGDADRDGFVKYVRHGPRGLANQGWKDSHDGIRFSDGTIARAPMALCEVQGYAFAAAMRGAELLDRFGRPGAEEWRAWAGDLRDRFRERFWVHDADGPYPAVAIDGQRRAVDSVASNMGHLLFTGILDADETALVARRLAGPDMDSGYGLRTLSSSNGGYNPISYHCGSVWPHDTAIAAWGLAVTGHAGAAGKLINGLVAAAPTFEFRLPELLAGIGADESPVPVPYPAACRPQAWAAGGALLLVRALFGLDVRIPDAVLTVRPAPVPAINRVVVRGLPLAGGSLDLVLDDGHVDVATEGIDGLRVHTPI